jgi:hypothetical protein
MFANVAIKVQGMSMHVWKASPAGYSPMAGTLAHAIIMDGWEAKWIDMTLTMPG